METPQKNFVIGISGASGALYARALLRALSEHVSGQSSLIISPAAIRVFQAELGGSLSTAADYLAACQSGIANPCHEFQIEDYKNIGARAASGSVAHDGMLIVPCSMKSLAGIAHGYTSNLIERAADVCLKERRKLVVMPRESPYSLVHLRNMTLLTEAGGIVLPASPGFYQNPNSLDDLARIMISRALALVGLPGLLVEAYTEKN